MEANRERGRTAWFREPGPRPDRVAELETTVDGLRRQVSELEDALTNARVIGAAVGVLMAMRRLSYEEAWAALRVASQASNRKVRDVARTVVLTGELAVSDDEVRPRSRRSRDQPRTGSEVESTPGSTPESTPQPTLRSTPPNDVDTAADSTAVG